MDFTGQAGTSQSWYGAASKTYPPQVQVGTDGQESVVTKLNDAPALRLSSAPTGKTYYKVGGECFTAVYARILIRNKR
jgi:hypothetical protein